MASFDPAGELVDGGEGDGFVGGGKWGFGFGADEFVFRWEGGLARRMELMREYGAVMVGIATLRGPVRRS